MSPVLVCRTLRQEPVLCGGSHGREQHPRPQGVSSHRRQGESVACARGYNLQIVAKTLICREVNPTLSPHIQDSQKKTAKIQEGIDKAKDQLGQDGR